MGPRTRSRWIGRYEWSDRTGFVQDVDAEMAASLLTDPSGQFEVDGGEPLLAMGSISREMAGRLALAGVASLEDLVGLSPRQVRKVAVEIEIAAVGVRSLMHEARAAKLARAGAVQADEGRGLARRG